VIEVKTKHKRLYLSVHANVQAVGEVEIQLTNEVVSVFFDLPVHDAIQLSEELRKGIIEAQRRINVDRKRKTTGKGSKR
jgi:predicted nucleic acid-binding OB-fold protein